MQRTLLFRSFLNSLGVVTYVLIVATIMNKGEQMFGAKDTFLAPAVFLLLFTVSAAVVGSLVFGYPVVQFLAGKKREGILAAVATIGWLVVETGIIMAMVAAMK